ncbi:MAG: hypothetical protein R3E50_03090 [Halioglobus sp.]
MLTAAALADPALAAESRPARRAENTRAPLERKTAACLQHLFDAVLDIQSVVITLRSHLISAEITT